MNFRTVMKNLERFFLDKKKKMRQHKGTCIFNINRLLNRFSMRICVECGKIEKIKGMEEDNFCNACWDQYMEREFLNREEPEWDPPTKTPCGCVLFSCEECGSHSICSQTHDWKMYDSE